MINKKLEFSGNFKFRIEYEFAARKIDVEKRKNVEYCGGNLVSGDPFSRDYINGEEIVDVDTQEIVNEFDNHAKNYSGNHNRICAHYVLSLQPGETLDRTKWLESVKQFMTALGYDRTTKYVAVIHRDTDIEHVHVVASRARFVTLATQGAKYSLGDHWQLVKDRNDYDAGMKAMRAIESRLGLRSPECDGLTKEVDRIAPNLEDQAQVLRGKIKAVLKRIPKIATMSELALVLRTKGVELKAHSDASKIYGLSYRLIEHEGRWISGSRLSGTQLTWTALQSQYKISYVSSRDDYVLLKSANSEPLPNNLDLVLPSTIIRSYIKVDNVNPALDSYLRTMNSHFQKYTDDSSLYIGFNIRPRISTVRKTKEEVKMEIEVKFILDIMNSLQRSIQAAFEWMFCLNEVSIETEGDFQDINKTAVKISLPATVLNSEIELVENWSKGIFNQVLQQLTPLAQAMRGVVVESAPSPPTLRRGSRGATTLCAPSLAQPEMIQSVRYRSHLGYPIRLTPAYSDFCTQEGSEPKSHPLQATITCAYDACSQVPRGTNTYHPCASTTDWRIRENGATRLHSQIAGADSLLDERLDAKLPCRWLQRRPW